MLQDLSRLTVVYPAYDGFQERDDLAVVQDVFTGNACRDEFRAPKQTLPKCPIVAKDFFGTYSLTPTLSFKTLEFLSCSHNYQDFEIFEVFPSSKRGSK